MKILLASSTVFVPTHGGENKANRLLLEGLAERGHRCRVVAPAFGAQGPGSRPEFLEALEERGLSVTRFSSSGADVFNQKAVEVYAVADSSQLHRHAAEEIRAFDPDWTLISSEDPGQVLLETALAQSPSRVIYLAHTMLFFPFGPNSFSASASRTALLQKTAGIITVSRYLKDYIRRWSGCDSAVVPFPAFGSGPFPRLGSPEKGFVTLINPCAYKGISIFLELARRLPEVSFAAVPSWGTTEADLAALARLPNVRMLPPSDGMDQIFSQTRVLLVPSLWGEGFPLVPVEAMLRAIPVVASDSGGLPESMLGVDFVLPVRPIERYTERFDERKLPVAVEPEQDIGPWLKTLRALLSNRESYERLSATAQEAAEAYVSKLSVLPFEEFFSRLPPPASRLTPPHAQGQADQGLKSLDLRKRVESLSPERRALLAARLKKQAERAQKPIPPRSGESGFLPLSFAQERLWFLDQMDPGNPAFNNLDAFRLIGRLDREALERSLNEIVRRHEALRTAFATVGGQPAQVIAPSLNVTLPVVDLRELPESGRESEARRIAIEEARRRFNLSRGPLLRAALLLLAPEEHILLLTMHHIVSDGWSFGVFTRELKALYEGFSLGRASALPELAIQYADYAIWQREWMRGEVLEKQLSYWKRQLGGSLPVLELPADHPRPAVATNQGAREPVSLSKRLTDALALLARQENATQFMTLLAAFQALLSRYTGQTDIAVGSPVANRNRTESEGLIGVFFNTLVLRTDLSGDPTFRELLKRVRSVALGAYAHQDLPFERLVGELNPERDLSHTPLFQAMLILQNAPREALELADLTLSPLVIDSGTAKLDLTLELVESGEGLRGTLEYRTDLFERGTIVRMLDHFQTLLAAVVANPDERLSMLPLLTPAERHQLLVEWNDTAEEYPRGSCVHELFETQVERTPEAVAVDFEGKQLTYRELNRRANQIARRLRRIGVGPDVPVGLLLERSLTMVVGLWAVLKAGGAYVPLDPAYPKARLSFMLEDSGAPVLLTQENLADGLPAHPAKQILLDADGNGIGREGGENLRTAATPENLAYLIYTSGSTGMPRGVAIPHRAVVNVSFSMRRKLGLTRDDVLLSIASISFDMSALDLFLPLTVGARVVLAGREVASDGDMLSAELSRSGATAMHGPPASWRLLLEADWRGSDRLKAFCGGEALPRELAQEVLKRCGSLWNLYGPTETTIYSALHPVSRADRAVPIGRPIANTQIFILDPRLFPVPIGVPGELYIGGGGVARGYFNRPELTAEKFLPSPFRGKPESRIYRTGDLARYLPDGSIEFLDRTDRQVKIRGYRVELGEVEAALARYAGVRESVVLASKDRSGEKRLVAYLVADAALEPNTAELRRFLKEKLPAYMVPSAFVMLDSLPLNPSGKVDRRALPAPGPERPALEEEFVAPGTPVEETVAGIWSAMLGVAAVGIHDNFFALGGHSLLATQVISRVRDALRVDLPLRCFFEAPTVAEQAREIEGAKRNGASLRVPPIVPFARERRHLSVSSQSVLTEPEISERALKQD